MAQTGPWLPHVVVESRLGLTGFLPKVYKNNFEGAFSRVNVCDVFALRSLLGKLLTSTLEKSYSKLFSDFGKKIHKTKPARPNNFSLGPKEIRKAFEVFVFL